MKNENFSQVALLVICIYPLNNQLLQTVNSSLETVNYIFGKNLPVFS